MSEDQEMQGMWPGGWIQDAHGNLAFAIRGSGPHKSEDAPVWACHLCQGGLLHTLAEHHLLTGEK